MPLSPRAAALALLCAATTAAAQDPALSVAPSVTVTRDFEVIVYTLTASNPTASTLQDVSVSVLLPDGVFDFTSPSEDFVCSGSCSPNETATWTLGDLAPGASRVLALSTLVRNDLQTGTVLRMTATSGGELAEATVTTSFTRVELSVAPEPGLISPGEDVTYTLTFGNRLDSTLPSATLRFTIPFGATFVSATDGGEAQGRIVTWPIDPLPAGAGGQRRVTIRTSESEPPGRLIEARGTLFPPAGFGLPMGATSTTAMAPAEPLQIAFVASEQAASEELDVVYHLIASNAGDAALSDVVLDVLLPDGIFGFRSPSSDFDCRGSCDPDEVARWTIGTLAPGASRTIALPIPPRVIASTRGRTFLSVAIGSADGLVSQPAAHLVIRHDPQPITSMTMALVEGPAVPGGRVTYAITFGNRQASTLSRAIVRMPVPEGTTFVPSSSLGSQFGDDIEWSFRDLAPGQGAQVRASFDVDPDARPGELLLAYATLDPEETGRAVESTVATTFAPAPQLRVEYTAASGDASPGDTVPFTLRATNTSSETLFESGVRVFLPDGIFGLIPPSSDFSCSGSCSPTETVTWTLGNLAPGASRVAVLPIRVSTGTEPGQSLHSSARGFATDLVAQPVAQQDLLVGAATAVSAEPPPEGALHVRPFPNPFRDRLTLAVTLGAPSHARIDIYDALGRLVATPVDGPLPVGTSTAEWDARGLPSGVYLYRLHGHAGTRSGTITLTR